MKQQDKAADSRLKHDYYRTLKWL